MREDGAWQEQTTRVHEAILAALRAVEARLETLEARVATLEAAGGAAGPPDLRPAALAGRVEGRRGAPRARAHPGRDDAHQHDGQEG
jgi:hypothetical protein